MSSSSHALSASSAPARNRVRRTPKEHRRTKVSSVAAVSWTTVLLSSSGVAGFSPGHGPVDVDLRSALVRSPRVRSQAEERGIRVSTKQRATQTRSLRSLRGESALWYRDSDDETDTIQTEHTEVASHFAGSPPSRWLGSLVCQRKSRSPGSKKDCEQYVLDDYLEFVDRRYHRLNDEEEESSPPGINTAWNWLMSQKPDSPQKQQRKEEDALYVLGLAGLASEELLQKHHLRLLPARGDHSEGVVIDAKFSSDAPDRPATQDSMTPVLSYNCVASLTAGMSVLHRAFERRLVIESLRLRSGVYAFIRAMRW
eukprot:CAMPEP_0183308722 /NCGR_PEP_ID=MMETSP0160_2-20130417/22424_1 /TAXON_ID=2839 ORGANISM="Odontella Sinensis, Strain Grunow 1884" /NCGR_SAMPLE_ID=MMETSP0160_2 /ASSEMBLY_ACC=CAM_ASM_000250 /LENGTH=311 /DNA_ID=CAMNT_0025472605 /DNA_START=66 /DNA_END=998 /DNA_ORIENTATION=-